ncbi:MAG: hypothetical protein AAF492_20020, partial [Verrucomicrobiota bacterium]
MKHIKRLLVVVVVLGVAILFIVAFKLGGVVKAAAEGMGPKVLGVPVTLEKAKVSPLTGKAHLGGLDIGNPEGFNTESLFKLSDVAVDMQVGSIAKDKVIINSIEINAPEITFEGSLKGSNIKKLLE